MISAIIRWFRERRRGYSDADVSRARAKLLGALDSLPSNVRYRELELIRAAGVEVERYWAWAHWTPAERKALTEQGIKV